MATEETCCAEDIVSTVMADGVDMDTRPYEAIGNAGDHTDVETFADTTDTVTSVETELARNRRQRTRHNSFFAEGRPRGECTVKSLLQI